MAQPPSDEQTPLMKQYWELKAQAGDALLLFRMGDFYELFGEDAVEASKILEITLTTRDKNKANPIPMAGVPHHALGNYLPRLLKAGKKVAIGEQVEEASAKAGKTIVRREIVRTFTPAIQFDAEGTEANFLAVLVPSHKLWVLACLDVSTGETLVGDAMDFETLRNEIDGLPIRHLLVLDSAKVPLPLSERGGLIETLPANYQSLSQAREALKRNYGTDHLQTFVNTDAGILALGILITYALRTQKAENLAHLRLPAPLRKPRAMALGPRTAQHLDLTPHESLVPNLYELIHKTRSALGSRQLRRWLLSPLRVPAEISLRQQAVRELASLGPARDRLGSLLAEVYDLERISGRVNARLANPRDTLALGQSLQALSAIPPQLERAQSQLLTDYRSRMTQTAAELRELIDQILTTQREDAPLVSRDGGIFKIGTDPELDRLLSLTEDGQKWIIDLEARERGATGISSLKVRYNRVFGYYIEITQAHLKNVPSHYQRKQTTVGAERFFTEELKKFEDDFVNASAKQKALEQELFHSLLESIQKQTASIMEGARLLGELDSLVSMSRLADEPGWCFPVIDDSMDLEIESGRHPLVDQGAHGSFVPNSVSLSPETRLSLMITGPNMGGKSTVMRQTALIAILGQMGAPVPAKQARWGAFSAIYTRIGAQDAISRGQSTFMVEMSELAHILHHADPRALLILDEIGRGTSTYDGMSVAWAALEWICNQTRARTLFATHYHELTRLAGRLPLLSNAHMAVEGTRSLHGDSLRFLYELKDGAANESFGVHVARLAGLPKPVIQRAWEILDQLESAATNPADPDLTRDHNQLSLFDVRPEKEAPVTPASPEANPLLGELQEELDKTDINAMTPVQALNFVARLQEISRESRATS